MFADDAKFFSTNYFELQACLNLFDEILKKYQLNLAPHKCFILPIGKQNQLTAVSANQNVSIESTILPYESYAKDLGIYVSKDLKWELHIKKIIQQASFVSYQILKSFRTKNIWTLVKLFKSYVRPKLEYNTQVWSPHLVKDKKALEKIQKRYTKIICQRCSIPFSSYSDRLDKLNLLSLENRRIRFDLILLFKIIHGLSDLNFDSFFKFGNCPYPLRNCSTKILPKQHFTSSVWLGSFFERAPKYWNHLNNDVTSAKTLNIFKSKIQEISYEALLKDSNYY